MAETALEETQEEPSPSTPDAAPEVPKTPIAKKLSQMSDRAIQRVTGGNAFLRGRLYARRKVVDELKDEDDTVTGQITVLVCNHWDAATARRNHNCARIHESFDRVRLDDASRVG